MFKKLFRRRAVKKALGPFFSDEELRGLADAPVAPACRELLVDIALVAITAAGSAAYSERAGIVAETAHEYGGTTYKLIPIIVVAFESVSGGLSRFIADVQSKVPNSSIVHGSIVASMGIFGSSHRFDYGIWWPGLLDALRQLLALAPGTVRELPR